MTLEAEDFYKTHFPCNGHFVLYLSAADWSSFPSIAGEPPSPFDALGRAKTRPGSPRGASRKLEEKGSRCRALESNLAFCIKAAQRNFQLST